MEHKLEDLLMQYVRERDTLSPSELNAITDIIMAPANVDAGINYLITVKRDVESQFIAMRTRLKDFYALCEESDAKGTLVPVEVDNMASGSRVRTTVNLPPSAAYAKFAAKEGRWKVKNTRFLALIESAIAALKLSKMRAAAVMAGVGI